MVPAQQSLPDYLELQVIKQAIRILKYFKCLFFFLGTILGAIKSSTAEKEAGKTSALSLLGRGEEKETKTETETERWRDKEMERRKDRYRSKI